MQELSLYQYVLIIIWVILALLSFAFKLGRNVRLKKLLWIAYNIATSLVFLLILLTVALPWIIFVIVLAFLTFITIKNIQIWRFCPTCGRMYYIRRGIGSPRFCAKCDTRIE